MDLVALVLAGVAAGSALAIAWAPPCFGGNQ